MSLGTKQQKRISELTKIEDPTLQNISGDVDEAVNKSRKKFFG